MLKIGITGIAGKMGRMIGKLCIEDNECELTAASEAINNIFINQSIKSIFPEFDRNIIIKDSINLMEKCDVIIDFTHFECTEQLIKRCQETKEKLVIGTTGLSENIINDLKKLSESTGVVFSSNMSLGVNLLFKLTEIATKVLKEKFDIEIIEMHHNMKKDAPSGTAVQLAERINKIKGITKKNWVTGRDGLVGPRKKEEVGISAIRGGDIVGEHTVMFAAAGERIELVHRANNREIFARGAIVAAKFLKDKESGFFNMMNVLGLE